MRQIIKLAAKGYSQISQTRLYAYELEVNSDVWQMNTHLKFTSVIICDVTFSDVLDELK